ncbi:amidase [Rhizobium lemnae]|uniref:Indoleacetamide hydrolase n=1 Tax=Rhizobium lemnae TaxID=1214924 RepID=A0ABV8EAI8_9HYPH|nr:amidase [Rhizobium lemnae]MCJ8507098.1 amidase [Rhizobium lemnae]
MNISASKTTTDGLDLASQIQKGILTPAEALSDAIRKVEKVNPQLNAIAEKLYETASEEAKSGIAEGPFAGVPILTKDLFTPVRGARMTNGSLPLKDSVMPFDAEITIRLRRAGFTIFGTTTSPEFGSSYTTESRLFGATRNPWSLDHICGGSSGGAAAMVAARVLPVAHGNDGGGSLRVPASACGVFGLKPSRGLTPMGPAVGEGWAGMSTSHVISISVRDSAAALDQLAGADLGAPYAAPHHVQSLLSAATGAAPKGLRIGLVSHISPWQSHADCVEAVQKTAELCQSLGHHVEETILPVEALEFYDQVFTIIGSQTRSLMNFLGRMAGHPMDEQLLEARHRVILRDKGNLSGADYAAAVDYIHAFGRRMAALFQRYDVLLTPTMARPPARIGELVVKDEDDIGSLIETFHSFSPFTALFNASGQPAMSVPLHWNSAGLPIGSHFAAAFGGEPLLFALAAQLEKAAPWSHRIPPINAFW